MTGRRGASGAGEAGDDLPNGDLREVDLQGWDERLADWVDDRMSERDRERFEAEMRVNPQLRARVAAYEQLVGTVRAALRAPTHRTSLADRVLAAAAADAPRPRVAVRAWRPFAWAAASAAALLGLAVLVDSWRPPVGRVDVAKAEHDAKAPEGAAVEPAERRRAAPTRSGDGAPAVDEGLGRVATLRSEELPAEPDGQFRAGVGLDRTEEQVEESARPGAPRSVGRGAGAPGEKPAQPPAAAAGLGQPSAEAESKSQSKSLSAPTAGGAEPPPASASAAAPAAPPLSDPVAGEAPPGPPTVGAAEDAAPLAPAPAKDLEAGAATAPTEFVALLTIEARSEPAAAEPNASQRKQRGAPGVRDSAKDDTPGLKSRGADREATREATREADERRLRDDLQRFFRAQLVAADAEAADAGSAGAGWSGPRLRFSPYAPPAAGNVLPPRADAAQPPAAAAPVAERWWWVEGTQADLKVLLAELRRFADAPQRSWRSGEIEVSRPADRERVARAESESGASARADAPERDKPTDEATGPRRMVLCFRVRD